MSEVAKNDFLSNLFGGIGGRQSNWLIWIVVLFLLFGGSSCGIGGIFGDQNLIFIFIIILILFGSSGFLRF